MVTHMTTQNYCMVNETTDVCDNVVVWDGDPNTWTPPSGYLMLVQATTPAKVWSYDPDTKQWALAVVDGAGGINYTWDGMYLITDQPLPTSPPLQAPLMGAQTL